VTIQETDDTDCGEPFHRLVRWTAQSNDHGPDLQFDVPLARDEATTVRLRTSRDDHSWSQGHLSHYLEDDLNSARGVASNGTPPTARTAAVACTR
jgi:hypothetical protein